MRQLRLSCVFAPSSGVGALVMAGALVALLNLTAPAGLAQLRIVSLNSANSDPNFATPRNPWMNTILSAIGSSVSDDPTTAGNTGIAKPIDILGLQEVNAQATTAAGFASTLNALYPGANYQRGTLNGGSTGSGTQGIVYNANAVQLLSEVALGTASTSGQPRQTMRYKFHIIGYDSSSDFYVYNSHYKASNDATSNNRKLIEANAIRADADALGAGTRIIYLGDYNAYNSTEAAYTKILSAGNGQGFDPINKPGAWDQSSTFVNIHTQSPYSSATATSLGTGFNGTTGGMDSRFDFQIITGAMNDAHGFAYINNSYQAFGNNGTHGINNAINSATNTAQPTNVLDAMAGILDHMPIVADYQLPAVLSATIGSPGTKVIKGSAATVGVTVSNAAPVSFAVGADTLTYSVSGTGAVTGTANGTDAALGATNTHNIAIDTAATGNHSGTVNVSSTSQEVANNNQSGNISYAVVDHSTGSFASGSTTTNLTFDYSYIPQGFAARTNAFSIFNRNTTVNFTAAMDIDSITNTGSTSQLTTNLATTSNLAAGSSLNYTATASTATVGVFSTTHTVAVSDENIQGAIAGTNLVITQTSRVIANGSFPVNGTLNLLSGESWNSGATAISSGVTINKTGPGTLHINGTQTHGTNATLNVSGGPLIMDTDAGSISSRNLALAASSASVTLNSSQHLRSLSLSGTATGSLATGGKNILTDTLAITGTSKLDLQDGSMIVRTTGARSAVNALVLSGQGGFDGQGQYLWNGSGLVSSKARSKNVLIGVDAFTLAVIRNGDLDIVAGTSGAAYTSFAGNNVGAEDVLVSYTMMGDSNLDQAITIDDYNTIDAAYAGLVPTNLGWVCGDFNSDGLIDIDDYNAIDTGYLYQGSLLTSAMIAQRTAMFGADYITQMEAVAAQFASVPEPAMLSLLAFVPVLLRRSRKA